MNESNLGAIQTTSAPSQVMHVVRLMALLLLFAAPFPEAVAKDHPVRGHVRKDGTYVGPTRATNPNRTQRDNYSATPNTNPANGKRGKRTPLR